MPDPRRVVGVVVGTGVELDRAAPGLVRRSDDHLQGGAARGVEGQRRLEREFLQQVAAHLVTGAYGQLDVGRCRGAGRRRR